MISTALQNEISATSLACQSTIYREDSSPHHDDLTQKMWAWVKERVGKFSPESTILDIGCGMGGALDLFQKENISCAGITLNQEEVDKCRSKGHIIWNDDMHEALLCVAEASVDGIWLRHAAEHSFMPLVLLRLCKRVLKPEGWIYLEVPSENSECKHESNANHFSVLTKTGWEGLLAKAGFTSYEGVNIQFAVQAGKDTYYGFLAR